MRVSEKGSEREESEDEKGRTDFVIFLLFVVLSTFCFGEKPALWAAAGFIDTLLRWKMKLEVVHGNEKAIQPGVQA